MTLLDTIRGRLGQRTAADYESLFSKERQDFLRDAADLGTARLNGYTTYENYYDGEQHTRLLTRAKQYLEGSGIRWCENFCETIVDVHADRLKVERFEVVDNPAATDWLNDQWWARNRMDETQGIVHTETLKLGDGCILGDYDDALGLPTAKWNNPARVKFCYDDDGNLSHAVKVWHTSERAPMNPQGRAVRRMNLYFDDRVEKWFSVDDGGGSDWAPWVDDEDFETHPQTGQMVYSEIDPSLPSFQWPQWWTDNRQENGKPLGVLAVHFRHKSKGRRNGRSLLKGTIPQQDALNKEILDKFYVMDAQGWPQRYAAGIAEGQSLTTAIGEWVTATDKDAKFGEFPAANPIPLQAIIDGTLRRISARTRTPLHELDTGQQPSGEARKTAEGGIVKASEDRQTSFGNSWEDTARMGWRIGSVFGHDVPAFDPDAVINVEWASAETRNEESEALVDEADLRMGIVSKQTIAEKRGFDWSQEQERILAERKTMGSPLDPFAANLPADTAPPAAAVPPKTKAPGA